MCQEVTQRSSTNIYGNDQSKDVRQKISLKIKTLKNMLICKYNKEFTCEILQTIFAVGKKNCFKLKIIPVTLPNRH